MTQLADQTALVTGANRGPGREFVHQLERGATDVLDGIEAGALEVMADDLTRAVRGALTQPVAERYAAFLPEAI